MAGGTEQLTRRLEKAAQGPRCAQRWCTAACRLQHACRVERERTKKARANGDALGRGGGGGGGSLHNCNPRGLPL